MSPVVSNFRSPAALARFFLVMLVGLLADLGTKYWAYAMLVDNTYVTREGRVEVVSVQPNPVFIPHVIELHVTNNHGAVFGMGQGKRWFFIVVSIVAIGFLTYLFVQSGHQKLYQVILGLLLAGVLGNMYDRAVYGYVRDMIYGLPGWAWPGEWSIGFLNYPANPERLFFPWIFNIADMMLCTGVFLMIVYSLFQPNPKPSETGDKVQQSSSVG